MSDSDNTRVDQLEEQIAHLTMNNDELSSEIVVQWKRIEELEKKLERLQTRFVTLQDAVDTPEDSNAAIEKPPHW